MPRYRIEHPNLGRGERIDIDAGPEEAAAEAARWYAAAWGRPAEEIARELTVTETVL